jgi:hypothetical protein
MAATQLRQHLLLCRQCTSVHNAITIAFPLTKQIIALWPSNLLLTHMNPKHFIPLIELGWTISTFGQAAMKNSTQMYVLRTLVGLFEA